VKTSKPFMILTIAAVILTRLAGVGAIELNDAELSTVSFVLPWVLFVGLLYGWRPGLLAALVWWVTPGPLGVFSLYRLPALLSAMIVGAFPGIIFRALKHQGWNGQSLIGTLVIITGLRFMVYAPYMDVWIACKLLAEATMSFVTTYTILQQAYKWYDSLEDFESEELKEEICGRS
jgi:hypothetical protein